VVQGAGGPVITQAPWITGTARVGQWLTANGGSFKGGNGTVGSYQWLRCTDATNVYRCSILSGSTQSTYRLVNEDLNKHMRVAFVARDRDNRSDYAISSSVGPVAAAAPPVPTPTPPPPRVTPTPTATVTPVPTAVVTPVATPAPAFDVAATPVATPVPTSGEVLHQTATSKKAKMLRPFPRVRVRGRLTAGGANVTLLRVRAPRGVTITVMCTGSSCPRHRVATKVRRLSAFERAYAAGTRITIKIAKPGYISKVTVLTVRRGAAPTRTDRCLLPGHKRTQRCPS
jgi:hypothetical protein